MKNVIAKAQKLADRHARPRRVARAIRRATRNLPAWKADEIIVNAFPFGWGGYYWHGAPRYQWAKADPKEPIFALEKDYVCVSDSGRHCGCFLAEVAACCWCGDHSDDCVCDSCDSGAECQRCHERMSAADDAQCMSEDCVAFRQWAEQNQDDFQEQRR